VGNDPTHLRDNRWSGNQRHETSDTPRARRATSANPSLVKIGQKIEKEFGGKYVGLIVISPKKRDHLYQKIFNKIKAITDRANQLKGLRPNGVVSLTAENFRDIRSSSAGLEVKPYVETFPETEESLPRFGNGSNTTRR